MTIHLDGTVSSGGDATGDQLTNIENLTATSFDDMLTGAAGNEVIRAGAGDDVVSGGAGDDTLYGEGGDDILEGGLGADALIGGNGNDTASYANAAAGVTVSLDGTAGTGGEALGDTLSGIENLEGSAFADTLGGVKGKGLWSSGRSAARYGVPAQPRAVAEVDWYVGVFVDSRGGDGENRVLMSFPDGSALHLVGRSRVRYRVGGQPVHEVELPAALAWMT